MNRTGRQTTGLLGLVLQKSPEVVVRDAGVFQNLGEQLGSDAFALVYSEHERASVVVYQEPMAPATTCLAEACALERGENPAGRQFGKPGHRLRRDDDLDGSERLARRLAPVLAERVDVELKGGPRTRDRLASGSPVHVAARHLGHRRDVAPVLFPVEGDDVAELHDAEDVMSAVEGQSCVGSRQT